MSEHHPRCGYVGMPDDPQRGCTCGGGYVTEEPAKTDPAPRPDWLREKITAEDIREALREALEHAADPEFHTLLHELARFAE